MAWLMASCPKGVAVVPETTARQAHKWCHGLSASSHNSPKNEGRLEGKPSRQLVVHAALLKRAAFSHKSLSTKPPQCPSPLSSHILRVYVHDAWKSLQLVKRLLCRVHLRATALGQGFPTTPLAQLTNKNEGLIPEASGTVSQRQLVAQLRRDCEASAAFSHAGFPKKATVLKSGLQHSTRWSYSAPTAEKWPLQACQANCGAG